ncbi:hypothetical protein [Kitasatospora indigofera]|uniref:hypothetical protein n=1 Tax=Kitasatospora indigofera TaxID=67307 RepID=UPI0033B20AA8
MSADPRALVYLCTEDDPSGHQVCIAWCEARAAAEDLAVGEVVVDVDANQPLAARPGWLRVAELIAAGGVGLVVTLNRGMVAHPPRAWERIVAGMDEQRVRLLTVGSPPSRLAPEVEPTGTAR